MCLCLWIHAREGKSGEGLHAVQERVCKERLVPFVIVLGGWERVGLHELLFRQAENLHICPCSYARAVVLI